VDIWFLIEYVLLNNTYIYKQIDKDRMVIKPHEVFDMIKAVYQISPNIYWHISSILTNEGNRFIDTEIANPQSQYVDVKKDHMFKSLMYEFMQKLQIYHPKEFKTVLGSYFERHIILSDVIDYGLIKKISENKTDLNRCIDMIIGLM
jgi:hypothetical protein